MIIKADPDIEYGAYQTNRIYPYVFNSAEEHTGNAGNNGNYLGPGNMADVLV
jgi:hypothetical protein